LAIQEAFVHGCECDGQKRETDSILQPGPQHLAFRRDT